MNRHNGFTLAEVLITLGIIGVVAAMTMPTLINQTNGAQYKAAYKKALSAISQGITLNVALEDKSFADATAESDNNSAANSIEGFLKQRMNVVNSSETAGYTLPDSGKFAYSYEHECTSTEIASTDNKEACKGKTVGTKVTKTGDVTPDIFLFFNDGSMFGFLKESTECKASDPCYGVIDVNGAKGPNKTIENAETPTDIYPVVFYDQTILPASDAAKGVLYGK